MAAHDRKWHITQDRADREKRRKWKLPGRDRHEKKEKKERRDKSEDEARPRWSLSRWLLCGGRCCEVSSAGDKLQIEDERRQRERKEERRARRREEKQKQRERDEWRRQHHDRGREDIGQAKCHADAEHTADRLRLRSSSRLLDEDSDGSGCTARSGYSGISRASSFASSCASYTSQPSERPERRRRSQTSQARETPEAVASNVKVLNLADLRGQDPKVFQTLQQAPVDPRAKLHNGGAVPAMAPVEKPKVPTSPPKTSPPERSEAPLSARSGRSEGAASVQSFRSMASTTVNRYSEQLSGPKKSSAEMKKLVKEFVREMVKGKEMKVLRADGSLMSVKCGLTRSLDTLRIKTGSESRQLGLKEVEKVLQGAPEELGDLETPLDEACATLVLQNECISFKFEDQEKAEVFTLCLNLFIDGLRKKSE